MKYAFIIGTSAFIVPHGVISYADTERSKDIISINGIYHDDKPGSALSINADIRDLGGNAVVITDNAIEANSTFKVESGRDFIKVTGANGHPVLHVHQLDDDSAMRLEHYITAELTVNTPVVVIRISGSFDAEGLHILAENEKLFINDNGYATAAQAGQGKLLFTKEGVIL